MMYTLPGWMTALIFCCLLLAADAQQRPRTRLEIMIDDFMDDMSSFATRINTALFAEAPPRVRRPAPRPQQSQPGGGINSFPPIQEVSNDIAFDSSNLIEDDQHHAPNSPQFNEHEFITQHNIDPKAQGIQDVQQQQNPIKQQAFRPRPPPRSAGFGIRQFMNRAMDRVRNMMPATRRRFTDPGLRLNNPQKPF